MDLRIIHLSTSHNGGAGIAARRLNTALNLEGINSTFVSLEDYISSPSINELRVSRSIFKKLLCGLTTLLSNKLMKKTYFTLLSISSVRINEIVRNADPKNTIIHVHNWFNLISFRDLLYLLRAGFKIVFTLHDQRIFTGGCHYSLNCNNYKTGCKTCPLLPKVLKEIPQINLNRIKKHFDFHKNQLFFFAPSQWMFNKAKESNLLIKSNLFVAPNPHGTFKPDISTQRNLYNSTAGELILGVASFDKNSPLKGNQLVLNLSQFLNSEGLSTKLIYLSDYQTGNRSDNFWASIDFLLVLSIADNSPNVIHEAKLFGIPVIATNVGGIPELTSEPYDLTVEFDSNMNDTVLNFLKNYINNQVNSVSHQITRDYKDKSKGSLDKIISYYLGIMAR